MNHQSTVPIAICIIYKKEEEKFPSSSEKVVSVPAEDTFATSEKVATKEGSANKVCI